MAPSVEALLLTERGELQRAEERSRAAVAAAETETDNIWYHAWTNEDLATVLKRAGQIDEARDALERALARWERKGCLPCAQRTRDQIASLGTTKS
jgi:tetratricopeptide (TPR) repeat protein